MTDAPRPGRRRGKPRRSDPGRQIALAAFLAVASLGAGALIAADTVATIDPLYRQSRPPRWREPRPTEPAPPETFTPIRWSGFAAAPPPSRDAYDDPALLAEPEPYLPPPPPAFVEEPPEVELPPAPLAVDEEPPEPDFPPSDASPPAPDAL